MGRIGLDCRDSASGCVEQVRRILELPNFKFQGLFTHFSSADSIRAEDRAYVDRQYALFCQVVSALRKEGYEFTAHCCNSAGTLLDTDKHCDAVRPGIILYGLSPSYDMEPPVPLRPVMTLKTTVAMVKEIDKGTSPSAPSRGPHPRPRLCSGGTPQTAPRARGCPAPLPTQAAGTPFPTA